MTGRDEMFPSRAHFRLSRAVGGQRPRVSPFLFIPSQSALPRVLTTLLFRFLSFRTSALSFQPTPHCVPSSGPFFSPPRLICFSTIPLSQSAGLLSNFISLIY